MDVPLPAVATAPSLTGTPLAQLTNERILPPFFDDVFATQDRVLLGSGAQGTVYKTRISPTSPVHFPPALNTHDFYAVKQERVDDDHTDTESYRSAVASLWIAQIWNRQTPNVARILFWLRTRDSAAPLVNNYTMVMEFVRGGTVGRVLAAITADVVATGNVQMWRLSIASVLAQVFAGVCEVRAAGIKDFVHGDLYRDNVLAQPDARRTCFLFDLGNGRALAAPTWLCKNNVLRISDFGLASGRIGTGAGEQVIALSPPDTDKRDFCGEIMIASHSILGAALDELARALPTIEQVLYVKNKWNEQSRTAHERAMANLTQSGPLVREGHEFRDVQGRTALEALDDARSYAVFVIEEVFTAQEKAEALTTHRTLFEFYYSAWRHCLAFLARIAHFVTERKESLLEALQTNDVFDELRTSNTATARDTLVKDTFLGGDAAALATVSWAPVSLVPKARTDLEYVNGRLAQ